MLQGGDNAKPQGAARTVTIPKAVHSFMEACRSGNIDGIQDVLRDVRVDMKCRGLNGMTPLMATAVCGRLDAMKFLVEKGADLTLVDDAGQNVLHLASMRGDVESVKYILSLKELDINAKTKQGWTATDWASHWNRKEVENILLSLGAKPSQIYPAETLQ